jgi:dipeptidase D
MHQKTQEILDYFKAISSIPRCSGKEDAISQWLQQWAAEKGFVLQSDAAANLKITVAASAGYESAPGIVFQGHMDMVCEKSPDSDHDFSKDPIRPVYDGDWLAADKTTLGADNGIALALGMALVSDAGVGHPHMELLFTVDEESGLNGAKQLEAGFINGKILLNVDSETQGVFIVACAGGQDICIDKDLTLTNLSDDNELFKLTVQGLKGGHSGIDIHRRHANANKILARALNQLSTSCHIRLISINGGTAHNAIPRDAAATLACKTAQIKPMQQIISDFKHTVHREYAVTDKNVSLSLLQLDKNNKSKMALTSEDTDRTISLLMALPHGVKAMSLVFENLVETSSNLARVTLEKNALHILTSQRSSMTSKLEEITSTIEAAAALAGAKTRRENDYPPWQPNMDSELLQRCTELYRKLFNQEPVIEAIHAGLECAIIGSKYPGMDMISLGPTIENPHSPDERLHIPSIERVWEFLVALLLSYKN